MKVIDLLNMMAAGKGLPHRIKLECVNSINNHNSIYTFDPFRETYINADNKSIQNATCLATLLNLKVYEEYEPRDIEVCGSLFTRSEYNKLAGMEEDKKIKKIDDDAITLGIVRDKIKEIIEVINDES